MSNEWSRNKPPFFCDSGEEWGIVSPHPSLFSIQYIFIFITVLRMLLVKDVSLSVMSEYISSS
jgi:hypothetical protein